jgi:hypothetical protein
MLADKDAGALWNELKLSQLVSDNTDPEEILPLALQSQLGLRRSKEKLLLEHTKQWKKPSYNVLKDRYASKPHEPPVLDASKLKTLADPLRGKYASYDKLMSEDEDEGEGERSKRMGNTSSTGRPHRYNSSNEYSGTPSSTKKGSPSRVGSSAFFLTAAGSDDEATDDYYTNRTAQPKVSKFRGKFEEAKRGARGGLRDVLSKPLLEQKKRQTTQPPGLQRKKSGKIPTAAELHQQQQQRQKKKNSAFSFTHIKSSIPPQQPLPKRRPPTKIFSVGPTRTLQPSGKTGGVRRGAAPTDQALGVGLDLSNVSYNGGAGASTLEARRAARLARAAAGGRVGGSGARGGGVQSKDTSDALPRSASGGGANAAARIRAARGGGFAGPSGAKSAPQLATVEETTLRRNGKIAPLAPASLGAGGGPGAVGGRPRKKSVSIIDPSLSPLEKKKGVAAATSPRSKQPPASPRAAALSAAAAAQPVDMNALRSSLAKIQANEAVRSGAAGVKDTDQSQSAAAILAQHAKRISSQFQKANELSSKFLSVDAELDERPFDMSAFMPKRKVVI